LTFSLANFKTFSVKNLSSVIRVLMERRELTGSQLGEEIGLSATSVNRIVNGRSRPRQVTLSRLMKRLCTSPEERQYLISAYESKETEGLPAAPVLPNPTNSLVEEERVTRYLEVKSMSVAFRNDVEAVLGRSHLEYQRDYRSDPFICDFLLKRGDRRIAIDCKYNVNRDWERTCTTVKLLRENLPCDEVIIVVPYENELARKAHAEINQDGNRLVDVKELANSLSK